MKAKWVKVQANFHDRGQYMLNAGHLSAFAENNGGPWWNWWIVPFNFHESARIAEGGGRTLGIAKKQLVARLRSMGRAILADVGK